VDERERTAAAASVAGGSAAICTCVSRLSRAKARVSVTSTSTVTGPTFSSNTTRPLRGISPSRASTAAVPTVGCPANGISYPGVKMRTRKACAGSSAGSTKVLSEKLNSRATVCMASVDRPRASGSTASWLPPNACSVNTSAMMKR
jgi:hypothetical protein